MTTDTPTPAILAIVHKVEAPIAVDLTPKSLACPVDDPRIVKAKHLRPGMTVRHYLGGAARGRVRTVVSARRIDDGTLWIITFEGEPGADFKAAYRFFNTQASDVRPDTIESVLDADKVAALREVVK